MLEDSKKMLKIYQNYYLLFGLKLILKGTQALKTVIMTYIKLFVLLYFCLLNILSFKNLY